MTALRSANTQVWLTLFEGLSFALSPLQKLQHIMDG